MTEIQTQAQAHAQAQTVPDGWTALKLDGFMDHIGQLLRPTDSPTRDTFGLQTDTRHKNHLGIIHGGVLTSLLDQVIALVTWNAVDRQPVVTVQMDTRFLGAAKVGDFLQIRATLRHKTRALAFVDAEILCADQQIASATAVMKLTVPTGQTTKQTTEQSTGRSND
nr:PaaI family thioesterase [Amylibacter sp.]